MEQKMIVGLVSLLVMIISVAEGHRIADCEDWMNNGHIEEKCSCSEGEILVNPMNKRFYCFPRDDRCPNGRIAWTFTSGFKCKCFWGSDNSGQCVKPCGNCENGWCSSRGKCFCNSGFTKSREDKCKKICEGGCRNGYCTNSGECTDCKDGYAMSHSRTCTPVCEQGCLNGFCESPGKCTCKEGYLLSKKTGICEPICDCGCPNGLCEAPGMCSCNEGYSMAIETNKCIPICDGGCLNGFCKAPEKCSCNEGYLMSKSMNCEPVCKDDCPNGFCQYPGECVCNIGFGKITNDGKCQEGIKKCLEMESLS